jgi:hypothetical protein
MGIISVLVGWFTGGAAGLGGKIASIAIGAGILIALASGGYLYLHEKNEAIAQARASLALAQSELSAVVAANGADVQTIDALRAQQAQAAAAEAAMSARDQNNQSSAATIQAAIDQEASVCPTAPGPPNAGGSATDKDAAVAPVLRDALAALAKVQANQGAVP